MAAEALQRQVDTYRSAVLRGFLPMEFEAAHPESFVGAIDGATVGKISFHHITAGPHVVTRTARHVRSDDPRCLKVSVQLAGSTSVEQGGLRSVSVTGDIGVYDTSREYEVVFEEESEILVMQVERGHVGVGDDLLEGVLSRTIDGAAGHAAPASAFLSSLAGSLHVLTQPTGQHYAIAGARMIGPLLAAAAAEDGAILSEQARVLAKIDAYIDDNLHEDTLGPNTIAAANFISVRHLHGLFRSRGVTVCQLIKEKRLRAALHMLNDPALDHVSIGAIGSRVGIHSPAQFSRAFKVRYGYTPKVARAGRIGHA